MQETDLSAVLASLSAKAETLVVENSRVHAQNKGLRAENEVLRKEGNDLRTRITKLEAVVAKHQAKEVELSQSIRRISDTLSLVRVSSEANFAGQTVTNGPTNGQAAVVATNSTWNASSQPLTFGRLNPFGTTSPAGPAGVSGSSSADMRFRTTSPPFGVTFGTDAKFGDTTFSNDPFKTSSEQIGSTSAPGENLKKESESSEPAKKRNLSAVEPSPVARTQAEQELQQKKGENNPGSFPLPTPLSRNTFGLQPAASGQEASVNGGETETGKGSIPLLLPPPRSTSFSYRDTCISGEQYATISHMPFFNIYSVEEIRLWDYVNADKTCNAFDH